MSLSMPGAIVALVVRGFGGIVGTVVHMTFRHGTSFVGTVGGNVMKLTLEEGDIKLIDEAIYEIPDNDDDDIERDEWSHWYYAGVMLACCDCGLTHDVIGKVDKRGYIRLRMRRNEGVTSKIRSAGSYRCKVSAGKEEGEYDGK